MPIQVVEEHPGTNLLDIAPQFLERGTGSLRLGGKGNRVRALPPNYCTNVRFHLAGEATLEIGDFCAMNGLEAHLLAPGASLVIGNGSGFNGHCVITAHERAHISFGADCLIAANTLFMASDVHKIYSVETGARLNEPGDITLGDRVWVANHANVLKNTVIGADSVVGMSSVVSGTFPANSLIAGVPAKVIKQGIRWEK